MSDTLNLDELERLAAEATPDVSVDPTNRLAIRRISAGGAYWINIGGFERAEDTLFHAAAREAVPKLIKRVRELERQRDAVVATALSNLSAARSQSERGNDDA